MVPLQVINKTGLLSKIIGNPKKMAKIVRISNGLVFECARPTMTDYSKIEPWEIRILNRLVFQCVRYSSPRCSPFYSVNIDGHISY